jgi:hypothetical protein
LEPPGGVALPFFQTGFANWNAIRESGDLITGVNVKSEKTYRYSTCFQYLALKMLL